MDKKNRSLSNNVRQKKRQLKRRQRYDVRQIEVARRIDELASLVQKNNDQIRTIDNYFDVWDAKGAMYEDRLREIDEQHRTYRCFRSAMNEALGLIITGCALLHEEVGEQELDYLKQFI